ncbi:MAG TPA: ribosome-associated translation inhibitor RaiA [Actinomycetota bacterium]|nr:ribosome-associated translation inhibitor RaiA [Actinomycetota bacterium]
MNLILKARGVDLTDRLREYATEKLTRSQRFFERIIRMDVELCQEGNARVGGGHRVEVTVKTPGETLRAHGSGADFFTAIDQASDRLEAQVRKHKERLKDRSHRGGPAAPEPPSGGPAPTDGEAPPIVRMGSPAAKPMTPEEAVLELETQEMQFLLFMNAETMQPGVLYRRSDGAYGLMEHQA